MTSSISRGHGLAARALLALSATALLGWTLDAPALQSVFCPGAVMNPMTALAFAALALAIRAAVRRQPADARLRKGLGAAAALAGALRLLADLHVPWTHIDEVLFGAGLHGNRMAPNTAACFVFTGTAVALLDARVRRSHPATWLLAGTAATAWLAVIGYALRVLSLYRLPMRMPMALPTAIGFLVTTVAVVATRPEREPVATLLGDSPGGSIGRRLMPIGLLAPPIVGWARLEAERATVLSKETGVSLMILMTSALFVSAVGWCARLLHRIDGERARAERAAHELARADELTGLRNRRGFLELARDELVAAAGNGTPAVVCFVDLDGLKAINDGLGHGLGDRAIADFADVLRQIFPGPDVLGRLGGDEFVVLEVDGAEADVVAARLRAALATFNAEACRPFELRASLGFARFDPGAPRAIEELLREADANMYIAKRTQQRPSRSRAPRRMSGRPPRRSLPVPARLALHLPRPSISPAKPL